MILFLVLTACMVTTLIYLHVNEEEKKTWYAVRNFLPACRSWLRIPVRPKDRQGPSKAVKSTRIRHMLLGDAL